MNYLLDTCIISELVKSKPEKLVSTWLASQDEDALFLSVLTLGEIQKGISRLESSSRKTTLQHWLDNDLCLRFNDRILPINNKVALTWGIIQGNSEKSGMPVATIDGLLGATAIAFNLIIVTRNEADFMRSGSGIFNPWKLETDK